MCEQSSTVSSPASPSVHPANSRACAGRAPASNCNILCMYVEQSYFARWWRLQPLPTRALVRLLVQTGQLSFANGGWCMHDEATPHYVDMIDQMTLGSVLLSPLSRASALTPEAGTRSCISSWALCLQSAGKLTRSVTRQPTLRCTPPWALTLSFS